MKYWEPTRLIKTELSIRYVALQQQHFKMRIKTLKLVRWRSKPKIMLLPKNTINIVLFPQWIDQCIILRRQEKSNFLFIHIYIFFAKHDNPDIVLMDNLTKFNFLGPDEQGYVFIICHNTGII